MGDKLTNVKEKAVTAKFTPIQYIIAIVSIIIFGFMNTSMFTEFPDMLKITFYATVMILSMLFGAKLLDIKGKVEDMANVLKDTRLNPTEKIAQITPLAIQILTALGIAFDMLNIESGDPNAIEQAEKITPVAPVLPPVVATPKPVVPVEEPKV